VKSETVVPVVVAGKTIGVIDAESACGPIDRTTLQDFAKQIAGML
jgi:putative methionine-R-sulfoxide reductase with GAF domain